MFKFWTSKEDNMAHYEGSFSMTAYADEAIGRLLRSQIIEQLVPAWIEQHGADLLDKITPDEMEKAIKRAVAEKLIK